MNIAIVYFSGTGNTQAIAELRECGLRGRLYNAAIFKAGYNIKSIIENTQLEGNYVTKQTRGYYKIFIKYFFDE